MSNEYFIDNSMLEHGCCWDTAICCKCEKGEGMYGGDVDVILECCDDKAQFILEALNKARNHAIQ